MDAQISGGTSQQNIAQLLALTLLECMKRVALQQIVDGCIVEAADLIVACLSTVSSGSTTIDEIRQQLWSRVGKDIAIYGRGL